MSAPDSRQPGVLFSPGGKRPEGPPPEAVTKMVIGSLDKKIPAASISWFNARDYPAVTHLHLWGVAGLEELTDLPPKLEWLDVQNCPDLRSIAAVESSALVSLALRNLPKLESIPAGPEKPGLFELDLKGCPQLPEHLIAEWLAAGKGLTFLDLSGNPRVEAITDWPATLTDIRCNGCQLLKTLPGEFPPALRRLELAGTALEELADLPPGIDYINLGGMRGLTSLPKWGKARTLFLHNSAVQMPPAALHGATATTNVAKDARGYFEDKERVGEGKVKRCKIMVLGNGSAGKTCLSLNISGGNPQRTRPDYQPESERISTTHGVQFHEMRRKVPLGSKSEEIDLHVWDFGGQEIYHNTHRLFLSTGTIFLLLWKPEQEGRKPKDPNDTWRPITYWIDYIKMACPTEPRIAVICSGQRAETREQLREDLLKRIGAENFAMISFFVIDSLASQQSDRGPLLQWIYKNSGKIVYSQGTCVPSYWEIAQDMVEGWVKKFETDPVFAKQHQQMELSEFGYKFEDEINRVLAEEAGRFEKLENAIRTEGYELSWRKVKRVLNFLSHSGWVYWNRDLYESRVIVGQKWALEGIYTLFQRPESHPESEVHRHLEQSEGKFTLADLNRWGWDRMYDETEQKLLLTYLQDVGLCFPLNEDRWWREEARKYLSLNHLRAAPFGEWEMDLNRVGPDESSRVSDPIELKPFHGGHWNQLLAAFGKTFGETGRYARDGFYFENEEGQAALVRARFHPDYLKGSVTVETRGPDQMKAKEKGDGKESFHESLVKQIQEALRGLAVAETIAPLRDIGTKPKPPVEVFISYTWDPFEPDSPDYKGYEIPVDYIYDALKNEPSIRLLRDKVDVGEKGSINKFMERIGETSYAIVVISDKYLRSPYCMWELLELLDLYKRSSLNYHDNLILIEHETSHIHNNAALDQVIEDWGAKTDENFPTRMTQLHGVHSLEHLRSRVIPMVRNDLPDILDLKGISRQWGKDAPEEILAWIKQSIGKTPNQT